MAASSSAEDTQTKLTEAKRIAEEMKADLARRKKEMADTTLVDASGDISIEPKCRLQTRRTLKGHLAKIYALNWCADNQHLVSAAHDGKLIVWHAQSTNKVHAIGLESVWVMTCGYSPSGSLVASGGLDNACSIFNLRQLENNQPSAQLNAHNGFLSCVRFESDTSVLTASGDGTCIKWDVNTQQKVVEFIGHTGDVICLALSPDRNTFISGGCDWNAKLWDIRTGKAVTTFRGHDGDINSCAFFPSGTAFATGSDDAHVFLWDIRSGQDIQRYKSDSSPSSGITSIDFSLSGKYLFSGYDDFQTRVWDTCKREVVSVLAAHTNRVSCLGVPPSGEAVCTGSWDANLKIYA